VITGVDTPDRRYGVFLQDRYILAKERVRFVGEPVAAVAAISEQKARQAVALIRVTYEDLPAILDPEAALLSGAPLVHPDSAEYGADFPYVRYGNVCMDAKIGIGDLEAGFRASDLVIEDTYATQPVSQVPMETHACVAGFDPSGRLTVWTGSQEFSYCHFELSQALQLPMTKIRVIPLPIGGGFGGKLKTHLEPICALLAMKADRPVRIALSREEEFISVPARAPFIFKMKTGVRRNGHLVAREVHILVDVGGYSDHAIATAVTAMDTVQGAYNIPNCVARAQAVYTNNPNWGCMRGYGCVEMNFAVEAHTDVIAQRLGMDPADIRYMNLWHEGDLMVSTQRIFGVGIKKTMDRALELSGYRDKKGSLQPHRGIGIANMAMAAGMLSSSAVIKINEDATVSIVTGITDIGTGSQTILCQVVAETLGIPVEQVQITGQDSDNSPYDFGSTASRTVFDGGSAVRIAAEDIRDKLMRIASETLRREVDELEYREGQVFVRDEPEMALDLSALVGISLYEKKGPVIGYGTWMDAAPFEEPVGEGYPGRPAGTFGFGTHVAEVEVDPETGKVRVVNYTAVHDAGRILNPLGAEGQIGGGVAQGVGYGLLEEMVLDHGQIQNPNLADYKVPTALDVPPITMDFVGEPDARGPFGAKGFGEHPATAPAPAIVNAILDATGVALKRLPITPERLYFALQETES
jgi:CO/xanthine dehydrogenase Mo-binding subunit